MVAEEFGRLFNHMDVSGVRVQVRTYNLEKQSQMRKLDPQDIDRLLSIKGECDFAL